MIYAVIHLAPRQVSVEPCETCGLTHAQEETACAASRDPYIRDGAAPGELNGVGTHCMHWWDGAGCCWCGDDPCVAAGYALG